ncbi:MAG TPA: hypothetical protein VKF32_05480 [Thermoanaerobaculia bacterium]|nr:hypothetical protein [Thermoanaerobaculia bacterium]
MHPGLLLSSDVKSKIWPWAPLVAPQVAEIQSPALSDPVWQFVPWIELARHELRAGRLPLWNPHQDGGVPLLGNAQSALGSPLLWPALVLGVAKGWNLSLLVRILVALAGAYAWLRDAGRSAPAATLGAISFALSGAFVAWLEHPHTLAAAPVPLVLLFASRVARGGGARDRALLAGTTALVLLGGHPETALMAVVLAGGVVLTAAPSVRRIGAAAGSALLGAGIAAAFLFPFLEYYGESAARHGADRHPFVLPLAALVRFVAPRAPGSHPIEGAVTVSLATLALAPFAFARLRRARETWVFTAVAALCCLAAYDGPVARTLSRATPIYFSRALLLLPLALGFLGALGLDMLVARAANAGRTRAASAAAWLLAACAGIELVLATRGVHSITPPALVDATTPLLARLKGDPDVFRVLPLHTFLPPNSASVHGLDDLRGYDALAPAGWRRERAAIGRFGRLPTVWDAIEPWDLAPGGAALDSWNVKYLLLHPQFRFGAEMSARLGLDLVETYAGPDGRILMNRRALPRVRLSEGDATIRLRTPLRWSIDTRADRAGELVVADPFFPGWVASVDGHATPLAARPGEPFRIPLPAGRHHVALRYRPRPFLIGLAVSLASLAVAGLWLRAPARP